MHRPLYNQSGDQGRELSKSEGAIGNQRRETRPRLRRSLPWFFNCLHLSDIQSLT